MSGRLPPDRAIEAETFIRANLPLTEVPGTGLRLHLAGPRSGLSRLVPPGGTPYWAHAWPGGVTLARHIAANPAAVEGRRAFEIGMGSGLVAIAALRAGARTAAGFDTDPLAAVATRLNAEANGVGPVATQIGPAERLGEILGSACMTEDAPTILAGDVFYDEEAASRVAAAFEAAPRGAAILIGDIGRRFLPRERLEPLARYPVRDVGDPPSAPLREGWVFRWLPRP
jgi:predicted nicotinamide N-methyase